MARPEDLNMKISILNINVDSISMNGSLNIGKCLIVRKKEKQKKKKEGVQGLSSGSSGGSE